MSDQTHPTVDPYDYLRIIPNSDGSITRLPIFPIISAAPDPSHPSSVLSKDIPLNQSKGTFLRIFLPREALDSSSPNKLPLVVYYHGGGFILLSAASSINHNLCSMIAADIPAVIVSVGYRLAPEHRLPAAYDDCIEALHWIKTAQDEWLTKYADFSNTYLMGSSAGGNIAYHIALRASSTLDGLKPLEIRGLILHQPFFGGTRRTASELRLAHNVALPLASIDVMWDLCLPCGVDRDHEYSNPTVGVGSAMCDRVRLVGWKVMVTGCDGDPLIDRQIELAKMMEEKGVEVVRVFGEGGHHGVEFGGPTEAMPLCAAVKKFILFP